MSDQDTNVFPPITDEEVETFDFAGWIEHVLQQVAPDIEVVPSGLGRLDINLHNGDWRIATIYGPPDGVLSSYLDEYPRQTQTEIFRHIVMAINAWYREATNVSTGEAVAS